MHRSPVREHQLTLLGNLEAATLRLHIHLENGRPLRQYWIEAEDPDGTIILSWSDATSPGPRNDLNLAEVMTDILEIFRLASTAE